MTKVVVRNPFPIIDRDSFLTPFDKMFDEIVGKSFPEINQQVGVNHFKDVISKSMYMNTMTKLVFCEFLVWIKHRHRSRRRCIDH